MDKVLLVTLGQIGIMFSFMIIGYLLSKKKVITDAKPFSTALMWVFLPAVVFDVFYKNFTVSNISTALPYLLAGVVLLGVSLAVAMPILNKKYKDRITKNTYLYSMVVSNMAYMGFPLIKSVFPQLYLFFVVFTIGFHLYIFTVGAAMFSSEGKKFSLKGLLSPIMIALFLGLLCGPIFDVADAKLPTLIEQIIGLASGCMSPIAMLITGITLAKLPVSKLFGKVEVYVYSALRLIGIPAVVGGLAYLCHLAFGLPVGVVQVMIIYSALPMGLNPVVFVEANGGDGTLGAQCAFISHILCIATLPLVFGLVTIL